MKFGCNYSSVLLNLLDSEQVEIDAVKMGYFGPFCGLHDMVSRRRQVLIHGFGWHEHIGMVSPETGNDWEMMNRVMKKYKNDALAVHFSVYEQDMYGYSDDPKKILEHGIEVFQANMDVPIMIENMDHNPMYNRKCVLKEAVDPDYIREICDKYDLSLLLDTAHAAVSAWHLRMDVYEYLARLPLDRLKEIHFIGTQLTDDQGLKDMHTPPMDHDFKMLDWIMDRAKPEMLTLEYGWPGSEFEWRTQEVEILKHLNEIKSRYGSDKIYV